MSNKKRNRDMVLSAFSMAREQALAEQKTTKKKASTVNTPAKKSQSPEKNEGSVILQVDEVTKAVIEKIIGAENTGASDETERRIAELEETVQSLSDDLKRCNTRISELEEKLKRERRRNKTEE